MNKQKFEIHERAAQRGKLYLKCEADLIESLQEVDSLKVYLDLGCRSLHEYAVKYMKLTDSVANSFVTVARKAKEVPALRDVIRSGKLQVQKARRITSVLNRENQDHWIKLAVENSQKVIEKEVAKVNPDAAHPERVKYISETRLNMSINVSEEFEELTRRVQGLESQRTKKASTREQALLAGLRAYIAKYDPLEKAQRAQNRRAERAAKNEPEVGQVKSEASDVGLYGQRSITSPDAPASGARRVPVRNPIPARVQHELQVRDQGQCAH